MASQATKMFSKLLTRTDIKKRLSIPAKVLPSLPAFSGSYAVKVLVMYGTRTWPVACTIRKKSYKKPVFSGGLWRNFVTCNGLDVGDRITMYKLQDENGTLPHYRFELEKSTGKQEVNETSMMVLAKVATDTFVDHVIAKPSIRIFGTNMSDNEEAHFSNCITKETAMDYGTSDATEESCCRISLDTVPTPTPYVGVVNLDLTLAQPTSDGVIVECSEQ